MMRAYASACERAPECHIHTSHISGHWHIASAHSPGSSARSPAISASLSPSSRYVSRASSHVDCLVSAIFQRSLAQPYTRPCGNVRIERAGGWASARRSGCGSLMLNAALRRPLGRTHHNQITARRDCLRAHSTGGRIASPGGAHEDERHRHASGKRRPERPLVLTARGRLCYLDRASGRSAAW